MKSRVTRRAFLASAAAAGAALTIRFPLVGPGDAAGAAAYDPSAALTITPDGLVTVHITKAEMGQGVAPRWRRSSPRSSRRTGRTSASIIRRTIPSSD